MSNLGDTLQEARAVQARRGHEARTQNCTVPDSFLHELGSGSGCRISQQVTHSLTHITNVIHKCPTLPKDHIENISRTIIKSRARKHV